MGIRQPQKEETRSKFKKIIKLLGIIIGLVVPILILINFYQGHRELQRMNHKIAKLKEEINDLKQEKKELRSRIDQVNSKKIIEQIAREKLGLVKEGEILYIPVEK
ncbi:Septum formation initiator [Halobacteroides halobius DSM 5150]|uniref:Septum formation initiator n=1 Tax=Halobacteroides halobius (strain ATCC 35273 / DSM 5150 / MD-1) TaxID=748449 RepID=L0K4E1_HALHC|nr:septum formation initiator family protein [Halobacteroides halobius]AGB40142.1 Septum formation initiator [Halobacteroides halobius DSM 5150]